MAVHPAPTSPKQQLLEHNDVANVWRDAKLQQPPKLPWGRLIWLVVVLALGGSLAVVAGWSWVATRYPNLWISRWWPNASTTIVREISSPTTTSVPTAVQRLADSLWGVAIDQGAKGIYRADDTAIIAAPLSSNGWMAVAKNDLTTTEPIVVTPKLGLPAAVTSQIADPGLPFIYLETTATNATPTSFVSRTADLRHQIVWVVGAAGRDRTIISRTIVSWQGGPWMRSDQLDRWWSLDQPITGLTSGAVVTPDGRLVGLLDHEQKIWPATAIDAILKPLLQQRTVERPSLGLTAYDRDQAVVTAEPTAGGWQINAPDGQVSLLENGAARKAGLLDGDVLLSIEGQPMSRDPFSSLLPYQPGQTISLTYLRQGAKQDISVVLGTQRPP